MLGTLNIGVFLALLFVAAYRLSGAVAATSARSSPSSQTGSTPS